MTGEAEFEGPAGPDLDKMTTFYRSHAPQHFREFRVVSVDRNDGVFPESYTPLTSYWSIRCDCGSENYEIWAFNVKHPDTGELVGIAPVQVKCLACENIHVLFDPQLHGYDPVVGGGITTLHASSFPDAERCQHFCSKCGSKSHRVVVCLLYHEDTLTDEWIEHRHHAADMFSWLLVLADCAKCGAAFEVIEYDCS